MEDTAGVVRLGMPYDQRPKLRDLYRFLTDYCKHWRGTGLQLGLKTFVLDQVEAGHHTLSERFRVTLEKWLQLNVGVTWSNLELAITNANRESLGLQPLTSVPTSQSEVTVMQSHDNQPRQDDDRSQVDDTNEGMVMVEYCVEKVFRDFVIMRLRQKYSKVVRTLIHIFKEEKVDIKELITTLCFNDVDKTSVFSTDAAFNIINTEIQLFQHVAQYCKGIYDYRALDILVHASDCPEAIKELTDFTESLHNSILTEIDLMSEHGELLHPDDFIPGTYKFIIEYVGGKCTIETKEMIQGIVKQHVRLNKGVLIFKAFGEGYSVSTKSIPLSNSSIKQDNSPKGNNLWTQEDLKVLVSKATKEAIPLPENNKSKILLTVVVCLVTVNLDEILATQGYLQQLDDYNCVYKFSATIQSEQQGKEIVYYIGKYGSCPAAICDASPSFNLYDSESNVSSITHELFPNLGAVISVGVAHGIAGKAKISDVLISSKVICCNKTVDELQTFTVSQQLTNIFTKPIIWNSEILQKLLIYNYKPSIKSGIIMSCLFDNLALIANKIDSEAIGFENGKVNLFADVQHSGINIVIVKAISDFGESSHYQPTAAVLAAYLVFKCLESDQALTVFSAKKKSLEMIKQAKDKHLTIKVKHAKILFCGAAHAGKTSFSRLLQGKPHIYEYNSSQVGETSQVLSNKVSVESSKWVVLDRKLEAKQLMMYLLLQKSENQEKDETCNNSASTIDTDNNKLPIEPVQSIKETMSGDQRGNDDVPENQPSISVLDNQPSETSHADSEAIANYKNYRSQLSIEKEMANLSVSELRDEIPNTWDLFTLLDTGGQPEFIKMLPAINDFAAITFLVLNMCKGINNNVNAEFSYKDHVYPEYELSYTNKELIECLLSSVRNITMVQKRKSFNERFFNNIVVEEDKDPKPVVCFIGSHADEVQEEIDGVLKDLDAEISGLDIMKNGVNKVFDTWTDHIMPIDNRTSKENVENSLIQRNTNIHVNKIRDESNKLLDKKTQYEIPISWFILELEVRKYCSINKKVCLCMHEIKMICDLIMPTNQSMEVEMIKEVMKFYHMFGTLLYFHKVEGMDDIVITNPQWLFNNLTKIIACKFNKNSFLHCGNEICDMENKGICTEDLLAKLTVDLRQGVEIKSFLELLVYLKVIAPINNCQYFIPSVLQMQDDKTLSDVKRGEQFGEAVAYIADEKVEIVPLLITSKFGTIPRGLFAFLIVELLRKHPEFHSKNNPSTKTYYCFADQITFRIDSWWYFTLSDKISYLMLQVRVNGKRRPSYHCRAQKIVTKALGIVCDQFNWPLSDYRYGFLCESTNCINKNHPALLPNEVPITSKIDCNECECMHNEITEIKTKQRIWFENVEGYLQQNDKTNVPVASAKHQVTQPNVIQEPAATADNHPKKPGCQPKDSYSAKHNLRMYGIGAFVAVIIAGLFYATLYSPGTESVLPVIIPYGHRYEDFCDSITKEGNYDDSGSIGSTVVDILNEKPEMADLNKIVVKKVMVQWEQLAEGFRYDDAIIVKIKQQNRENPEECCREFLRDWLVTDNGIKAGPKTWSTLFHIIKEYTSIASDIREEMIAQVKKMKG